MYDAIREKVGGQTLPGTDLGQAARAAMAKISGTSVTPTVFRDILGKYPEAEPEFIEYQGAQIPKTNRLYDVLKQQGMNTGVPPVTFKDLQGYHSELGAELSKGTLPGDVYTATRDLQESVTDMMQDMAKKAGANNDLITARKFYREYMDTFHEPPAPPHPVRLSRKLSSPKTLWLPWTSSLETRGIVVLLFFGDIRTRSPILLKMRAGLRRPKLQFQPGELRLELCLKLFRFPVALTSLYPRSRNLLRSRVRPSCLSRPFSPTRSRFLIVRPSSRRRRRSPRKTFSGRTKLHSIRRRRESFRDSPAGPRYGRLSACSANFLALEKPPSGRWPRFRPPEPPEWELRRFWSIRG